MADLARVFAVTDPRKRRHGGSTAFPVERGTRGGYGLLTEAGVEPGLRDGAGGHLDSGMRRCSATSSRAVSGSSCRAG
jgi:hypothetical protein